MTVGMVTGVVVVAIVSWAAAILELAFLWGAARRDSRVRCERSRLCGVGVGTETLRWRATA